MNPTELLDICNESIARWNAESIRSKEPMVILVVPRTRCPQGETIALFGRSGPKGRIATIKETSRGYDVVAYFSAVTIVDAIAKAVGVESPLVRGSRSEMEDSPTAD